MEPEITRQSKIDGTLGVVFGDINERNEFVSDQATVRLIDCDSVQFRSNGQLFLCEVGSPLFTPPELQGQLFRGMVRTPNHDAFGLAVLIFHLLFMGRHPFIGRYLGRGDMSIEQAIREYRFAYGRAARSYDMQTPLHALPLSVVSDELIRLFERAFGPTSAQPGVRPAAKEWVVALHAFRAQMQVCQADTGHVFPRHLPRCPWCALMQQGAPNFFITAAIVRHGTGAGPLFVLTAVWARIEQVPWPPTAYQHPVIAGQPAARSLPAGVPRVVPPQPLPPEILTTVLPSQTVPRGTNQVVVGVAALVCFLVAGLLALCVKLLAAAGFTSALVFAVWWLVLEGLRRREERERMEEFMAEIAPQLAAVRKQHQETLRRYEETVAAIRSERWRRQAAKDEAEQRLRAAERNWSDTASRHADAYADRFRRLAGLRDAHARLPANQADELHRLQGNARAMQRVLYLRHQFISDHNIEGIGPTRTATLASYGIETAIDVEEARVLAVPGFGPALTQRLVEWRNRMESLFVFDPATGLPPQDRQVLDLRFRQARQQIEAGLSARAADLQTITNRANAELRQLYGHIRHCLQNLAQAEADLAALP